MAQETAPKKTGLLDMLAAWEQQGLSKAEIHERTRKFLNAKAREKGVPLHGTFELTPLCNLDCKMCYVHLTGEQLQKSGRKVLTTAQWKDIMAQAIDAGMIGATMTGGEAMLHPGFDELFIFLRERGIETFVKTNGLLLSEEKVELFKTYGLTGIQLSLYGSDDETYEKVTEHRCFDRVVEGIRRVRKAELTIEISITPSRYMLKNVEALLAFLHKEGLDYSINPGLIQPREDTGRKAEEHDLTLDEYIGIYKTDAKLDGRTLIPACAEEVHFETERQKTKYGLRCGGGRSGFAVNWKGKLTPCLTLQEISVDLSQVKLDEAWRRVNEAVSVYPIPIECEGCVYQKYCTPCVVAHARGAALGHANPAFCKRAKRLVEEGILTI